MGVPPPPTPTGMLLLSIEVCSRGVRGVLLCVTQTEMSEHKLRPLGRPGARGGWGGGGAHKGGLSRGVPPGLTNPDPV